MKKKISKDMIVDTALNLIREKNDLKELNLREISRTLGCAHTNLYNYFSSYTELLWAAHVALQEKFIDILDIELLKTNSAELKLRLFFETFLDFYLTNTGWFRLVWLEYIGDNRPEYDVIATEKATAYLKHFVVDVWQKMYQETLDEECVMHTLHTVHCYIIGEVSNYISGRRFMSNQDKVRDCTVNQAIHIFKLLLHNPIKD